MTLHRVETGSNENRKTKVVLTFDDVFLRSEWVDDVPTISKEKLKPEEDLRIIEILEQPGIKATFFVSGVAAELFPNLLSRLSCKGFEIAAHGNRHENFALLDESQVRLRVEESLRLVEKCVGERVLGWRSPGLHVSTNLYRALKNTHIQWCSDIELPPRVVHVPFVYRGKVEVPIASIDLKLYGSGFSPKKVCRSWLSSLDKKNGIFSVVIHPWFQLLDEKRVQSLRTFLEIASSREDVTFCIGSDVFKEYVRQGPSIYGATLSTVSSVWKRFPTQMRHSLAKARRVL